MAEKTASADRSSANRSREQSGYGIELMSFTAAERGGSTRRRNPRYAMTCASTDAVSTTGRPARIGSRSAVRVSSARPAIAPPIASEPVSPMMMRAGAAFHQRKPAQAPNIAAATIAWSWACAVPAPSWSP